MVPTGWLKTLPHINGAFILLFLVISTWHGRWSESKVRMVNGERKEGDVWIGIFKACSDICPSTKDTDPSFCTHPFSTIAECRVGHCINDDRLSPNLSKWHANDLCDKSAVATTFAFAAILVAALAFYFTTWKHYRPKPSFREHEGASEGDNREARNRWRQTWEPQWVTASFFNAFGFVGSFLAWTVWAGWVVAMNDESSSDRAGPILSFDELSMGSGWYLQFFASAMFLANVFLCRMMARTQKKEYIDEERHRGSSYAEATDSGGDGGGYIDVDAKNGGSGMPMSVLGPAGGEGPARPPPPAPSRPNVWGENDGGSGPTPRPISYVKGQTTGEGSPSAARRNSLSL